MLPSQPTLRREQPQLYLSPSSEREDDDDSDGDGDKLVRTSTTGSNLCPWPLEDPAHARRAVPLRRRLSDRGVLCASTSATVSFAVVRLERPDEAYKGQLHVDIQFGLLGLPVSTFKLASTEGSVRGPNHFICRWLSSVFDTSAAISPPVCGPSLANAQHRRATVAKCASLAAQRSPPLSPSYHHHRSQPTLSQR